MNRWKMAKKMSFTKIGEKSDYEPMESEEDGGSMCEPVKFAVVTLQDSDEVMVVASHWLSTDKKQSFWPPFKSTERCLEAVQNNLKPLPGEKPWEILNVNFHAEHDTYEEAVNNQVEQKALKYGLILYKVVTLQKSNEITVIPAAWLNEEKAQCYWPPFKSPEKCTEAVKNRLKPPVIVENPWETLNVQVHMECATYKQAMEKRKSLKEQRDIFLSKSPLFSVPVSTLPQISPHDPSKPLCGVREVQEPIPTSWPEGRETSLSGIEIKSESSDSSKELPLTEVEIIEKTKNTLKTVTENLWQSIKIYQDTILKIKKMDKGSKKKITIGIFGTTGEGKSSLLNAILGKPYLLPSGCFGACTAIVTQVEANLTDSNYIAEIELISKEELEKELEDLFRVLSDEIEDRNDDLFEIAVEKITALYGNDAEKKTLEELKKDDRFAEIENLFSNMKQTISNSDVSEFAKNVACYIQHNKQNLGGCYWPLVKSFTIKIPTCLELLEHIVFVDIPGTGDCNKQRDDLWKSKLKDCSSVWIVSNISRATDDRDPWRILKHCAEELGPGGECKSINFICTKTDDIDPSSYIRMAQLFDKIPRDKDQKKECILHRNESAKTVIKEKFEKSEIKKRFSTHNRFLQVFTVSSRAFFDSSLNLGPSETEIPKLQDDLRTLNKKMNRDLTRDYVSEARGILSFIQSIQLDTNMEMVEMKDKVRMEYENRLTKSLNELDRGFDSIYRDLEQQLSKGVKESMRLCVNSTMKMTTDQDGRGFHKILEALCKNNGYYCSKNRDVVLDLNKELAKPMHKLIDEKFNLIFPVNGKTGCSVQELIDKFSIIQSDSTYPRSDILYHIQNFISTKETNLKEDLIRKVVDIKKLIYFSIEATIQNEMTPCYKEAAEYKGDGSMKRRQDLLRNTVDVIKQHMFNKAKMEMLAAFNKLKLAIKNALESELQESIKKILLQRSKITQTDKELEKLSDQLKSD